MRTVNWEIRLEGRAWSGDEAHDRWELTPEKLEMLRRKTLVVPRGPDQPAGIAARERRSSRGRPFGPARSLARGGPGA